MPEFRFGQEAAQGIQCSSQFRNVAVSGTDLGLESTGANCRYRPGTEPTRQRTRAVKVTAHVKSHSAVSLGFLAENLTVNGTDEIVTGWQNVGPVAHVIE